LPAECERLTERVVDILEPVPFDAPELGSVVEPAATAFRLSPLRHGTDGFYVASFRKTRALRSAPEATRVAP
jgi:16S rRNA C967 or C1407 C5-methylase (RsmB/RsmF family)